MNEIEKKLKNIPKPRLGLAADWRIRFLLFRKSVKKRTDHAFDLLVSSLAVFRFAAVALAIVLFVPGYAYASKTVVPGHSLYPLKLAVEKIEYQLAEDKPEKLLEFSLRRIEEAKVVAEKNNNDKRIVDLVETSSVLEQDAISNELVGQESFKNKFKEEREGALSDLAGEVGVDSDEEVMDIVALAIDGFERTLSYLSNMSVGSSSVDKKEEKQEKKINNAASQKSDSLKANDNKPKKESEIKQPVVAEKKDKKIENTKKSLPSDSENKKNNDNSAEKQKVGIKKSKIEKAEEKVIKMEKELKEKDYVEDDVEILVEKLNSRIDKAKKEKDKEKVEKIIEPVNAITDTAEHFVEKKAKSDKNKNKTKSKSNKNKK